MTDGYAALIKRKTQLDRQDGFEPLSLPDSLFDFQATLVAWAVRGGRKALLEDCGLGKTLQQLVWAQNVVMHTGRPVLILTPLGVTAQTVQEGLKFGIECHRLQAGQSPQGICILNYQRLHQVDSTDYAGVVCDESSILKAFDGTTRAQVTRFLAKVPYRLLCTATAAPNDYIELGTASEALGELGYMDMLNRFFKNSRHNSAMRSYHGDTQWRFKGHAEHPFWRWVSSWARALRRPSDMGFDDSRFVLPQLTEHEHTVAARRPRDGYLFSVPAIGLAEEREERRRTLAERCELAADLINRCGEPAVAWCQLNDEGDLIERLIPDAVQVSGKDSPESHEEKVAAFSSGSARVLVTKPVIGGWGMNWQHCAFMTSFVTHSFEQHYQSLRRCWRFGQVRPVTVHHIVSDGEQRVLENLQRKALQAERMFSELTRHMREAVTIERGRAFPFAEEVPAWLSPIS